MTTLSPQQPFGPPTQGGSFQTSAPIKDTFGPISTGYLEKSRSEGKADLDIAYEMSKYSPNFEKQLNLINTAYKGNDQAITAFLNTRFYGDAEYTPQSTSKGYLGRTLDRIYGNTLQMRQAKEDESTGKQGFLNSITQQAANAVQVPLAPLTEGVSTVIDKGLQIAGSDTTKEALSSIAPMVTTATQQGAEIGKALSDGLGIDIGGTIRDTVGPAVNTANDFLENNPTGRTIADLGNTAFAAMDLAGAGAMRKGVGNIAKDVAERKAARAMLGNSKNVADDLAKAGVEFGGASKVAVDKGIDPKIVRQFAKQTPETKVYASQIFDELVDATTKTASDATDNLKNVQRIIGDRFLDHAEFVLKERKTIGEAMGNITRASYDDVVDFTDEGLQYLSQLKDAGVTVKNGKITGIGKGLKKEIPALQSTLDFYRPDATGRIMKKFGEADDYRNSMRALLGDIQKDVVQGGRASIAVSEKMIGQSRKLLLHKMGSVNSNYQMLANNYARLGDAEDFFKIIGLKGNMDDITTKSLRTGEISRRVMGNASDKTESAFKQLLELSRSYGYQSGVDEMELIKLANELTTYFSQAMPNGFKGSITGAVDDFFEKAVGSGIKRTVINKAGDKTIDVYKKIAGKTDEDKIKALRDMINESFDQAIVPQKHFVSEGVSKAREINASAPERIPAPASIDELTPKAKKLKSKK